MVLPFRPSVVVLVLANVVPVLGVVFFGWDVFTLLLLFWAESAIIGFFNILKVGVELGYLYRYRKPLFVSEPAPGNNIVRLDAVHFPTSFHFSFLVSLLVFVLESLFFLLHFGGFMFVHLFFLQALFGGWNTGFLLNESGDNIVVLFFLNLVQVFRFLALPLFLLFLSHGFSFWFNFLGCREYQKTQPRDQILKPYSRVVMMHLVIIASGFLLFLFPDSRFVVVLLVFLKTAADARAHVKERGM